VTQYENRLPSAIHPITPREQRPWTAFPVEASAKRETRESYLYGKRCERPADDQLSRAHFGAVSRYLTGLP
jgi:hypothetical protein